MLRAVAEAARASQADEVVVVLPPDAPARRAALAGSAWRRRGAGLGRGHGRLAARRPRGGGGRADAVVILLADMPEVGAARSTG